MLELFSVVALLLAKMGSSRLLTHAVTIFAGWYQGPTVLMPYIVFTVLFITILTLTNWLGKLCSVLIQPTMIGSVDRFLGSLVGILKWGLGTSVCIWLSGLLHLELPEAYTQGSLLFSTIKGLLPHLFLEASKWLPQLQPW